MIRLERKLVPFPQSRFGARLVLLLSSNDETFLLNIESSISFPIMEKLTMEEEGRVLFSSITLKKGNDVVIGVDEKLIKESQKWVIKEKALYALNEDGKVHRISNKSNPHWAVIK
jgi:hypothetical protein